MKQFQRWTVIAFGLIALDAALKFWTLRFVTSPILIFKTSFGIDLWLQCVTNRGGAWGIFSSFHLPLLYFRIAAIFCMLVYLIFKKQEPFFRGALFLVAVGASANVIDCFAYKQVIDMIHFTFWGKSWGIFNVADSYICLGAFGMLRCLFKQENTRKKRVNG